MDSCPVKPKNQFSLTRAALSTRGRAKVKSYRSLIGKIEILMHSFPSFWRFLCGLLLLARLAVTAQPIITDADQVLGPVPSEELPASGTFWFVQHHQPPLPWNPFPELPVYLFGTNGGHFLVDDSQVDYVALREAEAIDRALLQAEMQLGIVQMSSPPELPGGGGGGGYDPGVINLPVAYDYGAGPFYIELVGVTNGTAFAALHGTVADEFYQIFSKVALTNGGWIPEGEPFLGQNSLTLTTFPILDRTNSLFLRAMSWQDSDGSGMPDWWQLNNFGHLGVDPYADPDGDGWVNMQEYQNGTHPGVINTPPAPTGLQLQLNGTNCAVLLSWSPPPGLVDSYTVEREGDTPQVFTVSTGVSLADTVARTEYPEFFGPEINTSYRVRANYQNGAISYWSERKPVQREAASVPSAPAQIQAVSARNGQTAVLLKAAPPDTKWIRICRMDFETHWLYGSSEGDVQWDVPIESFEEGRYVMPSQMKEYPDGLGYWWYAQTLGDGWEGQPLELGYYAQWQDDFIFVTPPFVDGRRQMRDNLEFIFRVANRQYPLNLVIREPQGHPFILAAPTNYVSSSFHEFAYYDLRTVPWVPEGLRPFRDNFALRNLALDVTALNERGYILSEDYFYDDRLEPVWPLTHFLNQVITNGASISSLLAYNESKWTYMAPRRLGYVEAYGIYMDQLTGDYKMESSVRNLYGLAIVSQVAAWRDSAAQRATVYPGGQLGRQARLAFIYPETERPVLETEEYLFFSASEYEELPVPGHSEFDPNDTQQPLLTTGIGNDSYRVYSWAKQSLLNGYPGVYGFLGQYFEQALVVGPGGQITTNSAGLLSEYGEFFPTHPGQAALVTMPDLDTGERGTGVVHVIKLQLDVNHDGNMELGLTSPDNTSEAVPFRFWANNDYDRLHSVDGSDLEQDDLERVNSSVYYNQTDGNMDCAFHGYEGKPAIPCTRDLEDYSRLWLPGMSSLMAVMPTNYTVKLTLNGEGQIRLFRAVEADGGTNYLFDELTASNQVAQSHSLYVGLLTSSSPIILTNQSEHFIWCGAKRGTAEVHLQVLDGSENVLADTAAYIELKDIKEMYERWTVGESASRGPYDYPYRAVEDMPTGTTSFQYGPPESANTPYILLVHGWNMKRWEKDRFAETAFKRLYWQGYQGRFGFFRWPTDNGFDGLWDAMTDRRNYDNSEFNAWKSAALLSGFLRTNLYAQYPGHVYLLAHSMGNVVAGEALRLATNQIVNTYIASQAAVPAHTYDGTIAPYSFSYGINFQTNTPNIYTNWFTPASGASRRVNFYNTNDYALQRQRWEINQLLKPDQATTLGWTYLFDGAPHDNIQSYTPGPPDDTPPWDWFQKEKGYSRIFFNIVSSLTDRYEVMSYAAQSRSTALGRTPAVGNLNGNVNLGRSAPTRLWPPDPDDQGANQYSRHKWHSAQFRSTNIRQKGYWQTLLSEEGFDIAP